MGLASVISDYSFYSFNFIEDEDRMKQYVDIITNLQPFGPYIMYGYSASGSLIFKITKELENHGHEVSDIILADSFWSENRASQEAFHELQKGFIESFDKTLEKWDMQFLKDKVRQKTEKYLLFMRSVATLEVVNANVHLITSEQSRKAKTVPNWDKFTTKPLVIYNGFGGHADMFEPDHLSKNAAIIQEILDKIKFPHNLQSNN
jgi:thioesterase domain-containing protein